MTETSSMYTIQPVIKLSENIEFPKCMYQMKNIQTSVCKSFAEQPAQLHPDNNRSMSVLEQMPLPGMKELEIRQEAILQQLTSLKEQVLNLKAHLNQSSLNPTKKAEIRSSALVNENVKDSLTKHDIVINASPTQPPYALLALCHLWRDSLSCKISMHTHSNVLKVPDDLKNFIQNYRDIAVNKALPLVTILIVWKNVGVDCELVVSPLNHITIRGEVNILRYLSRLGPSRFNYEAGSDPCMASNVDAILDTCHCLAWSRTVKDRQLLVRTLNAKLGKSLYLTGDDVTIADIAAWSVLSQLSEPSIVKDLTVNMSKWFQRCSGLFKSNSI